MDHGLQVGTIELMRTASDDEPLEFVDAVHQLAHMVPLGNVLSYGDVAELLGHGGARQAGKAMGSTPEGTPWWRIIRADGSMTPILLPEAQNHWTTEQTPRSGQRVNMKLARWKPTDEQWESVDSLRALLHNSYERANLSEADDQL